MLLQIINAIKREAVFVHIMHINRFSFNLQLCNTAFLPLREEES